LPLKCIANLHLVTPTLAAGTARMAGKQFCKNKTVNNSLYFYIHVHHDIAVIIHNKFGGTSGLLHHPRGSGSILQKKNHRWASLIKLFITFSKSLNSLQVLQDISHPFFLRFLNTKSISIFSIYWCRRTYYA